MGGSNIALFDVFTRVEAETQGVALTVVHLVFVCGSPTPGLFETTDTEVEESCPQDAH